MHMHESSKSRVWFAKAFSANAVARPCLCEDEDAGGRNSESNRRAVGPAYLRELYVAPGHQSVEHVAKECRPWLRKMGQEFPQKSFQLRSQFRGDFAIIHVLSSLVGVRTSHYSED